MIESCEWTVKEDLESLIGQIETLRLDFKQSKIFNDSRDRLIENLTREVSAFANTEGGTIVIGIAERKNGKVKVADSIDEGVDIQNRNPEWLQQIIESNVSPYIPGIRVRPIFLDSIKRQCAYVITVPPGKTAYQASDKRYYGRSEYESKALPDHEIRLRMFRGKYPNAIIDIDNCKTQIREKNEYASINERKIDLKYESSFLVLLRNTGEINIEEFKIQIKYNFSEDLHLNSNILDETFKNGRMPRISNSLTKYADSQPSPQQVNVYPGDSYLIDKNVFYMNDKYFSDESSLILKWKLYLKDAQPLEGEINLAQKFREIHS
ncbi:MAG: ATP-binding protein [Thermosynechococcaceae cyanobacterium]